MDLPYPVPIKVQAFNSINKKRSWCQLPLEEESISDFTFGWVEMRRYQNHLCSIPYPNSFQMVRYFCLWSPSTPSPNWKTWDAIYAARNRSNHEPTQQSNRTDSSKAAHTVPSTSRAKKLLGPATFAQEDEWSSLSVWVLSLLCLPGTWSLTYSTSACNFQIMGASLGYFKATSTIKRSFCQNPYCSFVTKLHKYLCFLLNLAAWSTFRFPTALALKWLPVSSCRFLAIDCDSPK